MNKLDIKKIRKELGLNQTKFGKMLGVSMRAVQTWESGERNMPESVSLLLKEKLDTQNVYLKENDVENYVNEKASTKYVGTPYYDIDFTASFLEVENSQRAVPDSYITHPFFKNCDYVVRASGQSMAKVIKHGDAIGLIEIKNWREFLQLGEIYAIVTDEYRMIKVITKGDDRDSFTLISKPSDGKSDEFPPQQLPKKLIRSIYKVQASSHLF